MPNRDSLFCHNTLQKLRVDFDRGFLKKVTIRCEIVVDFALMLSDKKTSISFRSPSLALDCREPETIKEFAAKQH